MKKPRLLWENLSARAEKKDAFAKGRHLSRPFGIRWRMGYELSLSRPRFLRVRRGMTLETIARAYCLPPRVLAAAAGLEEEPDEGQVLLLPAGGNLYRVRGGETKALLSGSEEQFQEKNCTKWLYPTQKVLL